MEDEDLFSNEDEGMFNSEDDENDNFFIMLRGGRSFKIVKNKVRN